MRFFKSIVGCVLLSLLAFANAQSPDDVVSLRTQEDARAIASYWTPEQMEAAKAMPVPTVTVDWPSLLFPPLRVDTAEPALPGYVPGCPPGARACDTTPRTLSFPDGVWVEGLAYGDQILTRDGAKPTDPLNGPYGPFQRWRAAGPINRYPKSAIGKLFFRLNGGNFVCSASVIGRSTLITAGHCISDGAGNFGTRFLFCPSYNYGPNAATDCWVGVFGAVPTRWHVGGDQDYDYSCLVTARTGRRVPKKIGTVTGWLGRAWNFDPAQAERTFGYPQGPPFNGNTLQTTASTDWYTHDFVSGDQISKIIGSDLTGGSSGGPWVLGWTSFFAETADTDGSLYTDPGTNWVNGVNSHKRCLINCDTPPTATNGLFWQEMTSPPFRNTGADGAESEDVAAVCLAHANN